LNHNSIKLDGKKILITGVSREIGIGATLAKRLAESGAEIAIHGYSTYDLTVGTNNGAVLNGTERIAKQYENLGLKVTAIASSDLETIGNAEKVCGRSFRKIEWLGRYDFKSCLWS